MSLLQEASSSEGPHRRISRCYAPAHRMGFFRAVGVFGELVHYKRQVVTGTDGLKRRHLWPFSPEEKYDIGCEQNR